MEYGKSGFRTFEQGISKEWLLTNGIGGFASSTIIGANTRRYHGLLVASLLPPVQRHLVLSNLHETVEIDQRSVPIHSYQTHDFVMQGYHYLERVTLQPLPRFEYRIGDCLLEKRICMRQGENTVYLVYHIRSGSSGMKLSLMPLVNFRDYHSDSHRQHMAFKSRIQGEAVKIKAYGNIPEITLFCSEGSFTGYQDCYFERMHYALENERGLEDFEDHYIPGVYEIKVEPMEEKWITFAATIESELQERDGAIVVKEEEERLHRLVAQAGYGDAFADRLVMAADQFIVQRASTGAKTVIAGYPWFTDWGRDTMIAFPGIALATGRCQDARGILHSFSKNIKHGLLPNVFADGDDEPAYNTVDAALWYIEAVKKYLDYTGDVQFIESVLYPGLEQIIHAYREGTLHHIQMDSDFLIAAGDAGTQLTWMDAKVGDYVVTPRHGKAVEINALWYNALKVMEELSARLHMNGRAYGELADKVKEAFNQYFWNEKKACLFDVLHEEAQDDSVRPNQIMAVSLSFPVLEGERAKAVVDCVWKELYTVYGLRSLSPSADNYRGIYTGDRYNRDSAYHQGTVWTWLLGHFITAFRRVNAYSEQSRELALLMLERFKDHLEDACVGSISEIFDGDAPHWPRGAFAQAWSVGEILRVYTEDIYKLRK